MVITVDDFTVGPELDEIGALVVGDAVGVVLALLRGDRCKFVENAERPRQPGVGDRCAGERQASVDRGHDIAAREEVECPTGGEIEEVPADITIIEVAGSAPPGAGGDFDFESDAAARRDLEAFPGEVHVLGVVEDLDVVVAARVGHGRDLEPAIADEDERPGFPVLPGAAVGEREAAEFPPGIGFEDAVKIADHDLRGGGGLLRCFGGHGPNLP
ncbi:MAG: hypothetical protein IPN07_13555 [Dehalococcoidia bacterium]|nr:hypothetical protein [Dehalococcoidia bacterium]